MSDTNLVSDILLPFFKKHYSTLSIQDRRQKRLTFFIFYINCKQRKEVELCVRECQTIFTKSS